MGYDWEVPIHLQQPDSVLPRWEGGTLHMLHSRGPGPVEVWELLSGNLWPTGRWEKWGLSLPQATVGLSRTPWGSTSCLDHVEYSTLWE